MCPRAVVVLFKNIRGEREGTPYSAEMNGINRRAFIRNAVRSATVIAAVPAIAHALGDDPPREEKMALVFDVKQAWLRGYTSFGPQYDVAPADKDEWASYLRGEFQPQTIEGRITRVFVKKFTWMTQRNSIDVIHDSLMQGRYGNPKVIKPMGPCENSMDVNSFQVRSSGGNIPIEHTRQGDDSYYVVGRKARVEVMRFYSLPFFPLTFPTVQRYQHILYFPTRIWIEEQVA